MLRLVKFSVALLKNTKLVLIKKIFVTVRFQKVFTDSRILVLNNALITLYTAFFKWILSIRTFPFSFFGEQLSSLLVN